MEVASERARSAWLLAFGDVITLLMTFFIMMIALNKGEVSKIQVWVDQQVSQSYVVLEEKIEAADLGMVKLSRSANGILLSVNHENAFRSARFEPSEQLSQELDVIGKLLPQIPLLNMSAQADAAQVIEQAAEDGLHWFAEVTVEGHTDNDKINPEARIRNNWFLSTLRAQSVMQRLFESSQLPASLFSVAGYADYHPIASNETAEGKAKNRRVDILISATFQASERGL